MKYIDSLAVSAPVAAGDVLSGDIAGTGVGMVATWTVQKRGRERE
jgi:CxxC motif-containing protein